MTRVKKMLLVSMVVVGISANTNPTYAWKSVYDSQNYDVNIEIKNQEIKQVEQQAQQLKNELANLSKLDPASAQESIARIRDLMQQMNDLRNQTNAIGTDFRNMMELYDQLRPDYASWNGASALEYAEQIDKIRNAWETSIEQSMRTQSVVSPYEQKKTADLLERLITASQDAEGAMGALQAGNQIAALMVQELQKMQTIMADSMRTQNLYQQRMIEAEMQSKKISEDFLKSSQKFDDAKFRDGNSKIANYKDYN